MRWRTKLRLYKGIFLLGALAAVLLWQVHWALAVLFRRRRRARRR